MMPEAPVPNLTLAAEGSATRTSTAYSLLRRDIVRGVIHPGMKLRVETLAASYGIGPTPIREALNRLVSEELVTQQDQRGFRVTPVSKAQLLELSRTRVWVTEIAVREAINHGDQAWEEGIVLAFHRLSKTPGRLPQEPGQLNPEWEVQHRAFHNALMAACPSRLLLDFSARLFDAADRYRNLVAGRRSSSRDIGAEHKDVLDAFIERRTADAIALLNAHTERTTQNVLAILNDDAGGFQQTA